MRWVDIGADARGFVAIGQFATGVFAFGQVAWGLVAVGQIAFGGLAIGQVAVGGVSIGLVGVGMQFTAGMIGIGGRGRGWILRLLPSLGRRRVPTGISTVAAIRASGRPGWVRLHLVPRSNAAVAVFDGTTHAADIRLDARVRRAGLAAAPGDVWAELRPSVDGWVANRLIAVPRPRTLEPRWWFVWGAQLMGLLLLAAIVWWAVGEVLLGAWFGPDGIFRS
ncbi:MAG: hypothetical protein ABMB14_34700 [Myxococcota bacterium]